MGCEFVILLNYFLFLARMKNIRELSKYVIKERSKKKSKTGFISGVEEILLRKITVE
jgi:hypothetical protein